MKIFDKKLQNKYYFDNSATSRYKPFSSIKELLTRYINSANAGRGGNLDSIMLGLEVEKCREQIATLCPSKNIVLTKNCTEALNLAIIGGKLKKTVITSVLEHNSVLRPLYFLERQGLINLKILEPGKDFEISSQQIKDNLTSDTAYIVLTECSNVIAVKNPIEDIAKLTRENGIKLIIDTAQSLGHVQTDYKNVDVICSSGHKGLLGAQGTGFIAFDDNYKLSPLLHGGTGTEGKEKSQPFTIPEGFEAGTLNSLGFCTLAKSIEYVNENFDKINNKISDMTNYFYTELTKIKNVKVYTPANYFGGTITFNIGNLDSSFVGDTLSNEHSIAVRAGIHCAPLIHQYLGTLNRGAVRVSIGYNNTFRHVKHLLAAVYHISMKS